MTCSMSKAGLQQGMQQGMVATPALQLFMRALQAGTTELQQMAVQAMAANPVLEELPPPAGEEAVFSAAVSGRLPLEQLAAAPTLVEHLQEQLLQSALPQAVEKAALLLVQHLDEHGYFEEPPEEIAARESIPPRVLRKALAAVQDLEPAGVGASDLRQSLQLQLRHAEEGDSLAMRLLNEAWEHLVQHRYAEAARLLDAPEIAVAGAARRIAQLNPDPGSGFSRTEHLPVQPDLEVFPTEDGWDVRLTGANVPRLALSAAYREMLAEQAHKPEVRGYLSRCFREGRELLNAFQERQQTILKVAKALVAAQNGFFYHGPSALVPLKMETIAADTGLHVSTISRAVNGKYLRCAFGVWELRALFSQALSGGQGSGAVSSAAVQERLRKLVQEEDVRHPLSDAALEELLAREGIVVARRTIAKYREMLKILPASLRRRRT